MSKRRRAGRSDQPRPLFRTAEPEPPSLSPAWDAATAPARAAPAGIRWAAVLGPAAVALALYLVTLAPTVATGDSGELATVAATLGLAHPPGYPTFTLLGHVFTWLPFGDPAYRVNLLSAVLDAAAVAVAAFGTARLVQAARGSVAARAAIARAGIRGTGGRQRDPGIVAEPAGPDWLPWAAGAIAGLSLALSTAFWRYSLVAEVFALANALALVLLVLMLEWSRRPDRMRLLWAAAATAGLALTNQQTIVFAAPALVILLGVGLQRYTAPAPGRRTGPPIPWGAVGIAVLVGFVGLLPYLYLPIAAAAGAPSVWGDPTTPGGFLGIVSRSAYGTLSLTVRDTSGSVIEHLGLLGGYLVSAFTPVGIVVAAIGAAWLAARRTAEAAALGTWFLMTGPIFLALANPPLDDPVTRGVLERFYLLPSLPVALAVGAGTWWIATALATRVPAGPLRRWLAPAVVVLAVAALAGLAATRLPTVDESGNRVAEAYADDLLGSLPAEAVLLMRSDENYTSVTYAQEVRGVRPDVIAIDVELLKLDAYVRLIESSHPGIQIPFDHYDGGDRTTLVDVIDNVRDVHRVFVAGELEEDLTVAFDVVDAGLVEEVLQDGEGPDPLARLRSDPGLIDRLHPPDRTWPPTTWEAAIAAKYADVAFRTAVALQGLGPQANWPDVERLYRAAIRISPTLVAAYKNLGLLLQVNGAPADQIIPLWEEYLRRNPDDPEASAIRSAIERLKVEGNPTPAPSTTPSTTPVPST